MSQTKAAYAASLDPITNGHIWVINQGINIFKDFVVAVAENPLKRGKYTFTMDERIYLAGNCISKDIPVVSIGSMYLVDFAQQEGITHLVRGARNGEDFYAEAKMAEINRQMAKKRGFSLETIILTPPSDLSIISSSFVKSLVGYNGWENEIKQYVPGIVADCIIKRGIK